ncbi:uridine 5-carboxymethylaminomethyl modification enzyme MnmG [Seminavis robusta]|uniref:Uridine 5-carboxymethylaminomethyl modification enzyme MnmG n=1 Tax=Seminavis robusta TaxID=568900 RepID=A0A9N8DXG0_9STRA|nr:uridine 5-carboxymethylaminomethyl modification enzyme MnmG [Seminavis robusta]|eukprot:Sro354_g124750.1 uridine 5-carboxymethylaminomethyl modification enzyme MnmG (808) ;mRNA; r:27274-29697
MSPCWSFMLRAPLAKAASRTVTKKNNPILAAPRFQPLARSFSALHSNNNQGGYDDHYDVIVVGGGHAGCEAAAAAARTGAKTALITQRLDTVGELSCNPSIGGIGKGHLVREVDALGGLIGTVADDAGIHYRVLNRRKGPAVRGPRAQMDRDWYKESMQQRLVSGEYPNLTCLQGSVQDLLLDESKTSPSVIESLAPMSSGDNNNKNGLLGKSSENEDNLRKLAIIAVEDRKARIRGVQIETEDGTTRDVMSRTVIITTGTFLRGVLLMGHDRYSGGRHLRDSEQVEPPSVGLAKTLARFQFPLGRLKTGTPPRLDGSTIDWDICPKQPSEIPASPFSHILQFRGEQPPRMAANQIITCAQTATNDQTHELVMKYEDTLPHYDGMDGAGNGPRYCPSIYKKVQRFPERNSHNCFLEPEGFESNIVYPNGMSGPFPPEIQLKIMRSMKGLGAVEIVRPGYDVEYDFVNPQSLTHTLETKAIAGLYLAGQICGTTGYEEAAAQGIVAGANAGQVAKAAAQGEGPPLPFIIGRDEGYIGVLIDDLVTRGTSEPYRMFTSRAEYRISLRADNADLRLTRKGMNAGLVHDEERIVAMEARESLIEDRVQKLRHFDMKVIDWANRGGAVFGGDQVERKKGQKKTAEEVLAMPHTTLDRVEDIMIEVQKEQKAEQDARAKDSSEVAEDDFLFKKEEPVEVMDPSPVSVYDTVEASVKYQVFVRRQHRDMESWRRAQGSRIPPDIVYSTETLPTLKKEEIEKLNRVRPGTFAEASQISGVTPQSLVYVYHYVKRRNQNREGGKNSNPTARVEAQQ